VIIFGTAGGDEYEHAVIVVKRNGDNLYCNAYSNDRYHRSWKFWWGYFTVAHFIHLDDNAGYQANLRPYTPDRPAS